MANRIIFLAVKTANNLQLNMCKQARPLIIRSLATPAGSSTVAENVRKKQEMFGIDDNTPVYIKGGVLDNIMYRLTMGCCVLSLILIGRNFLQMAFPKKKK